MQVSKIVYLNFKNQNKKRSQHNLVLPLGLYLNKTINIIVIIIVAIDVKRTKIGTTVAYNWAHIAAVRRLQIVENRNRIGFCLKYMLLFFFTSSTHELPLRIRATQRHVIIIKQIGFSSFVPVIAVLTRMAKRISALKAIAAVLRASYI